MKNGPLFNLIVALCVSNSPEAIMMPYYPSLELIGLDLPGPFDFTCTAYIHTEPSAL